MCIIVCIIYSFATFSEKLKDIRGKIYLSAFLQFANFVLIVLPIRVSRRIDYRISIVFLLLLFVAILSLHRKIKKRAYRMFDNKYALYMRSRLGL